MQEQPRLDEEAQRVMQDADGIAVGMGQPKTEPEHLLLAMLRAPRVMEVLAAATRGKAVSAQLDALATDQLLQYGLRAALSPGTIPLRSMRTQSLLILATSSMPVWRSAISLDDLLLALVCAKSSTAELFEKAGVDREAVIRAMLDIPRRQDASTRMNRRARFDPMFLLFAPNHGPRGRTPAPTPEEEWPGFDFLRRPNAAPPVQETEDVSAEIARRAQDTGNCLFDMLAAARAGRYDAVVARDAEVERVVQVLARRRKNNPLLVGEPGVGKTAIAEGLALRIAEGRVPPQVARARLFSLNLGAMLAGTHFRGDFEARMQVVLDIARRHPDTLLFIDEMHTVIGTGSASGQAMDAATLMKPALASGDMRVLGATTFEEYRRVLSKDRAILRRFQKVDVRELSPGDAEKVIASVLPALQKHHSVSFAEGAAQATVALARRYLHDRRLPDSAIDVLDEAASRQAMRNQAEVAVADIEAVVASMAGVPVGAVASDDRTLVRSAAAALHTAIFGQDQAIDRLASVIKVARAGLRRPDRPLATLLMAGPTGVGKTETARELAAHLGIPLLRFDMSEFSEPHSVSKLIGAVPGYVGHEQGGRLTEAVAQKPYAVVLLDEIEKAHPAIYNLLLQVMDAGRLTDASGKEVDFSHVILLMTTNAGGQALTKRSIGFIDQPSQPKVAQEVAQAFSPEFRNRLDAIIAFGPLDRAAVLRVVDKNLAQVADRAALAGIAITVSLPARDWLAERGFDPEMGARPLARVIEEHLQVPLADAILSQSQLAGVTFDLEDGELVMRPAAPSRQEPPLPA